MMRHCPQRAHATQSATNEYVGRAIAAADDADTRGANTGRGGGGAVGRVAGDADDAADTIECTAGPLAGMALAGPADGYLEPAAVGVPAVAPALVGDADG